jgi:hypothetical protein
LEEIIFENFKTFSENNIISVELAKVLRYLFRLQFQIDGIGGGPGFQNDFID